MDYKKRYKQTEIGIIPEEWNVEKIKNIASNQKYSITMGPFGSNITKDNFINSGVPVIRGVNLNDYIFNENGFVYLTEEKANELISSNAHKLDIVFTHRGTLGQVGIIPENGEYNRYVVSQSQMKLTCDKNIVNPYFIFYFLKSPIGQYLLLRNTSQTGVPALAQPLTSLKEVPVPIPSKEEQNKIVKILRNIDLKIKLNRSINITLETIGKEIFSHWFIYFEFPNDAGKSYKSDSGKMTYSEELDRDIPEGWRVINLKDFVEFEKGIEPGSKSYSDFKDSDSVRFIRIGDLCSRSDTITYVPLGQVNEKLCLSDDILLSLDATLGIVKTGYKGAFSSGIRKVKSKENELISKPYIYWLLKTNYIQNTIKQYASGTTILHAGKSIDYMKIALPPKKIMKDFTNKLYPLFKKIINNLEESKTLSDIRDALLPKLMTGKLRVKILDSEVET